MTFPMQIAAVLIAIAAAFASGYKVAHDIVSGRWAAEKLAAEQQAESNRLLVQAAINKIDSKGAAKAKKQAKTDQSILEKVETNVPSTLPLLPGTFRVQHDSAATGEEANDTSAIDAAPVSPRTVAKTLTRNYAGARSNESDLEELQAIIRASGCFDIGE